MDFAFNEEQTMFQQTTRQYLQSKGDLAIPRNYMEGKQEILTQLWGGLAELGFMGINVPEQYGGIGLGHLSILPILEEMGRAVIPGPYPETVAFAIPLLNEFGTEEQKKRYLPDVASGKTKFTLAIIDDRKNQLKADLQGDNYVLNGAKILVAHAEFADLMIVAVRTGASNQDVSLLIVDHHQLHAECQPVKSIDETRTLFTVSFSDFLVPKENLLGQESAGDQILKAGLNELTAAWSATMVGGMDRVVDMSAQYVKTREQFGQPVGRFQAVKHKVVDMLLALENARSLSYYASWTVENKAGDTFEAVSMAKSYNSEAFIRTANANIQNHGGMGFTWEFDCHLFLKRARSLENYLGSPQEHRENIAKESGWNKEKVLQYNK